MEQTYVIIDRIKYPLEMERTPKGIELKFGFNKRLREIIKTQFDGVYWCGLEKPPRKSIWRVDDSLRNRFRFAFLQGKNPYKEYDKPLADWESKRPLMKHQFFAASHLFQRHGAILAGEMGTGKTLAFLDVVTKIIESRGYRDVWYIGPRSGLRSVEREIRKWGFPYPIQMFTYQGLVNIIKKWKGGSAPRVLILDESHMVKNPRSQRYNACKHIADSMRKEHGPENCWIMLTSGTPAPREPADWWAQAEIACPGYLTEGNKENLRYRLALIEQRENVISGGMYPHLVTWKDDPAKCEKCGELEDHHNHSSLTIDPITAEMIPNTKYHSYEKSVNEVARLYDRLKGLVLVQFKKDCLDLPEKEYEIIRCKPTPESIRAMHTIKSTTGRAVTALMRMRELSDGFQYTDRKIGTVPCPVCNGLKNITQRGETEATPCDGCEGTGEVPEYERVAQAAPCPKDDIVIEQLEEMEETGRIVIWAGFSGTIDKLVNLVLKEDWVVLRYDRQVKVYGSDSPVDEMLDCMDASNPRRKNLLEKHPKVAFIGNPEAGGMGLTLTASPISVYYSNPFKSDARIQSEDRIHRAGMDTNRACKIIDIFNLPTDELVYNNLKRKRDLQSMTMMELEEYLNGRNT